jgi:hypothetical protein
MASTSIIGCPKGVTEQYEDLLASKPDVFRNGSIEGNMRRGTMLTATLPRGDHNLFRSDVVDGLSRLQKTIPCRWLYDERGSDLFEEITRLEDYYPTRAETAILRARQPELRQFAG